MADHQPGSAATPSLVLTANAFTPCHTFAGASTDLAGGGPVRADTVDSYLTHAARLADLCDHAIRLMSGASDIAWAEDARAKTKATAVNLIIVTSIGLDWYSRTERA